ncbi:MAG: Crp/Fnr family transcriptional regulator [Ilumatobacter sp.]|nr:Crp/Fnr family transcriptional regulator [Ilumatobacter sp.]
MPDSQQPSPPRLDWRSLSGQAGLDERELRAACRRRRYRRGDTVFHEGDPAGPFHLLDIGRVAVRLTTLLGDVSTIDILQPGDTFGEQTLIHGAGDRSATVVALDRVETLTLDAATFDELGARNPAVQRFLLMVLSNRLRATSHQLLEARFLSAEQRLAHCLSRLAHMFADESTDVIPLTQTDIASMTGVTRSTVNRLLHQAAADGTIEIARGRLRVLDAARLHHRARTI